MDINLSIIDAEMQKLSINGIRYFYTLESSIYRLKIELNDLRININLQLLNLFIKLAKKLNVYD